MHRYGIIHQSIGSLSGTSPLRKEWLFSPTRRWQLSISNNPSPGNMTLQVPLLSIPLLSMPEHWMAGSYTAHMQENTAIVSLWEQWPLYPEDTISQKSSPTSDFHNQSFYPIFYDGPWVFQGRNNIDVSLRDEHSIVLYSLQVDQLSESVLSSIYYKNSFSDEG